MVLWCFVILYDHSSWELPATHGFTLLQPQVSPAHAKNSPRSKSPSTSSCKSNSSTSPGSTKRSLLWTLEQRWKVYIYIYYRCSTNPLSLQIHTYPFSSFLKHEFHVLYHLLFFYSSIDWVLPCVLKGNISTCLLSPVLPALKFMASSRKRMKFHQPSFSKGSHEHPKRIPQQLGPICWSSLSAEIPSLPWHGPTSPAPPRTRRILPRAKAAQRLQPGPVPQNFEDCFGSIVVVTMSVLPVFGFPKYDPSIYPNCVYRII